MGHGQLRLAASSFGTPENWANELGLELALQQRRCCARWTPECIEAALRDHFGDRTTWPTKPEFEQAGLLGLYEAIGRAGTRRHLAAKLGLSGLSGEGYYRRPDRWTAAAIDRALAGFLEGRDTWPTQPMFSAAGFGGLYQVITKSPGGHDAHAARHGLARPSGRQRVHAIRQ